ncbi:hypothetical protein ACSTIT_23505, partial [Vibrio parahaemolyticus]
CEETAALLGVSTVLLGERDGRHVAIAGAPDVPQLSPIDLAAADWAFDRGEVTGRASGTLTASACQF